MKKRCTKCGIIKDLSKFYTDRKGKYGRRSQCKECRKKYDENNKNRKKQYSDIYCKKNRETLNQSRMEYYNNNRELERQRRREYYKNNKEKEKQYEIEYHKTPNGKATHIRGQHKRRARKKNLESSLTTEQWLYILEKQNNRCNICGRKFTIKRPPSQDHIIPLKHNGAYSSDNIQALCPSCNSSKSAKLDKQFIQTWI
jgi:Skp family chaperone for outer membrane proteins